MDTLADRIWLAWWSLPRVGRGGQPPAWNKLEDDNDIGRGTFSRIIKGERKNLTGDVAARVARALNVSVEWLLTGEGTAPIPAGQIPARHTVEDDAKPPSTMPERSGFRARIASESNDSARDAACIFARASGYSFDAIAHVQGMPAHPYTPDEWLSLIKLAAANSRIASKVR